MHVACEMQKRLRTLDLRLSCSHILSHTFSCSHALMLSLSVCSHAHMNTTLATLRLTPLPTSFQVKRQNVKVSKCQSVKVSKHQSIKASKSQRVKASRLTCHTRKNENRFASADSSDHRVVSACGGAFLGRAHAGRCGRCSSPSPWCSKLFSSSASKRPCSTGEQQIERGGGTDLTPVR